MREHDGDETVAEVAQRVRGEKKIRGLGRLSANIGLIHAAVTWSRPEPGR